MFGNHRNPVDTIWYQVAEEIYIRGFLAGKGMPHIHGEDAIYIMAKEFHYTSESYHARGSVALAHPSYTRRYKRLQPSSSYTDTDKALWLETIWGNVVDNVADVVTDLECPDTTWLPDYRIMHCLHSNVILGVLWSIAHIPNENERNHMTDTEGEEDSDS